ncbi:MAG: hypothetical protein RJA19_1781 [Bacteroidota bacterium]|jgi:DnaJ like chaperone protein
MSRWKGQLLGGALGWALGGPIGALIGSVVGGMFTAEASVEGGRIGTGGGYPGGGPRPARPTRHAQAGDFAAALLVLSAAVMRADDKVMRSELDYVKSFLRNNFPPQQLDAYLKMLQEILERPFDLALVAGQIRQNMEHPKRLLLLQYLYGIAQADGHVHTREVEVIRQIAAMLGISDKDRRSIEEPFFREEADPYTVLEIERTATEADIKKAYRRLAVKFHPDKVQDLGPEHQQQAQTRFLAVQAAYERIKAERGIK